MSAPSESSGNLEAFFQAWKAVENVDTLDRESCESFLLLVEDWKKISTLFQVSDHCLKFTERFQMCDADAFLIGGLITEKKTELKAHLEKLAPPLNVDFEAGFRSFNPEAQEAFVAYKDLSNSNDYATFTNLFLSIYAPQGPNHTLGLYLRLFWHWQNPACILTPTKEAFLSHDYPEDSSSSGLQIFPKNFRGALDFHE